jgi:hypothetical protein
MNLINWATRDGRGGENDAIFNQQMAGALPENFYVAKADPLSVDFAAPCLLAQRSGPVS